MIGDVAHNAWSRLVKALNDILVSTDVWRRAPQIQRHSLRIILVLLALAVIGNTLVRYQQLSEWRTVSDSLFFKNESMFSTADAPYFLGHAKSIHAGETSKDFDAKRLYPNQTITDPGNNAGHPLRARPLLSVLLSWTSKTMDASDLVTSANLMILIAAAATALMIATCFGAAGYWLEGTVASLGGGLSAAYLTRSSIGRIDTDQLNLGFLYLLFGLTIFAGRATSFAQRLAWSIGAGVCAKIFYSWYCKTELIVIAAAALLWLFICFRRGFFSTLVCVSVFIATSGIGFINPLDSNYLASVISDGNFIFPNTFQTITEVTSVSLPQILVNATGSIEMGIVCLTGLALFLVRHTVIAIAYGPLVAFGLLNFIIGNRAIFYSAPIMWFGAAFFITTSARFVVANLSVAGYVPRRDQAATILGASLAMVVAWVNSPTEYVPRPSFPKQVLEGLASLKSKADPTNSAVVTWWDYGYASMYFNDLPTFHDGGSQTTPSTHFVAAALLDADQASSIGNIKFLGTEGHKGIAEQPTVASLKTQFSQAINAPSPDLYFVLTEQMAGWMSSISQIGNWNIETGTPVTPRGNNAGPQVFYEPLNCRLAGYPQRLNCADLAFDLEQGLVNSAPALSGWAHSQDGALVRRRDFENNGDFALQIVQIGHRINFFFMHRQLFESTFNELYHLGQINHPYFSLHYDDYPHIRIYKVKGDPAS